jgi:hypothetical protein
MMLPVVFFGIRAILLPIFIYGILKKGLPFGQKYHDVELTYFLIFLFVCMSEYFGMEIFFDFIAREASWQEFLVLFLGTLSMDLGLAYTLGGMITRLREYRRKASANTDSSNTHKE